MQLLAKGYLLIKDAKSNQMLQLIRFYFFPTGTEKEDMIIEYALPLFFFINIWILKNGEICSGKGKHIFWSVGSYDPNFCIITPLLQCGSS